LAFSSPVNGATEPDYEASNGTEFEEVQEDWRVIWMGDGLVLWAPVGVREGCESVWIQGKFDEGFKFGRRPAGEFDTEISSVNVVTNGILGRVYVARRTFVVVLGNHVGDGG